MGPRRVFLPRRQAVSAGAGAVHGPVSLVLSRASGRRLRLPDERSRSRGVQVGEGVQSLRSVFEERGETGYEGTAAVLSGIDRQVFPESGRVLKERNRLERRLQPRLAAPRA